MAVRALAPSALPSGQVRESAAADELEATPQQQRRRSRFALRDTLAHIAKNPRHRACGRYPLSERQVQVRRTFGAEGQACAHFTGVQLCGLVWTCPVCGPRIRQRRADDINAALGTWYRDRGKGSILFLTLTFPHDFGEELSTVFKAVRLAFSRLVAGYGWQRDKKKFGLEHYIRAHDVTTGTNGWHPHLHILLFAKRGLEPAELLELRRALFARWVQAIGSLDRRLPTWEHGVRLEAARSSKDLAFYLSQVAGDDERLARPDLELARGDLKTSTHAGQRTPWQVLADLQANASPRDLALWREWETATKGAHSIRWSNGLRKRVGLGAELSDEQIVMEEIGGEVVYQFRREDWKAICGRPGVRADVLEAAEQGGTLGVRRLLNQLRERDRIDKHCRLEQVLACLRPSGYIHGAATARPDQVGTPRSFLTAGQPKTH